MTFFAALCKTWKSDLTGPCRCLVATASCVVYLTLTSPLTSTPAHLSSPHTALTPSVTHFLPQVVRHAPISHRLCPLCRRWRPRCSVSDSHYHLKHSLILCRYCNRCKRGFKSEKGLALHVQDSRRHWECPTCTHDADGWDALLEHCRETKCRSVCQGCDGGVGEHWRYYSNEFWQHVNDCNVCTECEEHFKSYHELKKVGGSTVS